MDLVSVETPEENTMVENIISKYNATGVWTSGRLCNFHGCDVSDVIKSVSSAPYYNVRHLTSLL